MMHSQTGVISSRRKLLKLNRHQIVLIRRRFYGRFSNVFA